MRSERERERRRNSTMMTIRILDQIGQILALTSLSYFLFCFDFCFILNCLVMFTPETRFWFFTFFLYFLSFWVLLCFFCVWTMIGIRISCLSPIVREHKNFWTLKTLNKELSTKKVKKEMFKANGSSGKRKKKKEKERSAHSANKC